MRIFLIISVIVIAIKQAQCRIDLKHDKEVIIDIDSPELHQSQYHTADFNTSAYNYGYAVEPNGQFHHETRGGDGVTYGCYGYIDTDDLLKVTHYVADSQGYRTLEHEKPVLVYPIDENDVDIYDTSYKPKGVWLNWKELYFPIGCGMAKGGVVLNAPVIRAPDGHFKQLGETKFPVQPSNEPKVVVPRIPPVDIGIKTAPTKLIPLSPLNGNNVGPRDRLQLKVATSPPFTSTQYVSPSTKPSESTYNRQSVTTKIPSINLQFNSNSPQYSNYNSKLPNDPRDESTLRPTSFPNSFGETIAPFIEPVTVRVPTDTIKLSKVTSSVSPINSFASSVSPINSFTSSASPINSFTSSVSPINSFTSSVSPINSFGVEDGHSRNPDHELLPPFRTTNFVSDRQTTVSVPFNSINPDDDFNIINSYAPINPGSITTSNRGYKSEDKPTRVPINNNVFSNENSGPSAFSNDDSGPSTLFTFTPETFTSKEITPFIYGTKPPSTHGKYQISNRFSIGKQETSRISSSFNTEPSTSQRPYVESSTTSTTTPSLLQDFETSTFLTTYPGIGDYKKPPSGFEFNIPTRAPVAVTTSYLEDSFVTSNNMETTTDDLSNVEHSSKTYNDDVDVDSKVPNYDDRVKISKFTNGPHGAEYQLSSRIPHSQFNVNHNRDQAYNYQNAVKQSRKETNSQDRQISLITPLTHLAISGTYPSKNDVTITSIQTDKSSTVSAPFFTDHSQNRLPSLSQTFTNSFNGFESQRVTPVPNNNIQPEREPNHTKGQQPIDFFASNNTPKSPSAGVITHMDAISQTRFQSSRVTPSLTSITSNDQQNPNELRFDSESNYYKPPAFTQTRQPEVSRSTETPFLYTRPFTTFSHTENQPSPIETTPDENLNLNYGNFGQRIKPVTTSFTAYNRGSTSRPNTVEDIITPSSIQDRSYKASTNSDISPQPNYQPKFVLRQGIAQPVNTQSIPNSSGYTDVDSRNVNFYPNYIQQKSIDVNKNFNNEVQPQTKYVNTKKEFIPQYNPNSTPIPGSLGTAIGVYPPNLNKLSPDIPNFSIAISKWPFYILPFPFVNGMSFPFINGMPFPLGNGNNGPLSNSNNGNEQVNGGNGEQPPAQTICSWLSSFIQPQQNGTNTEVPTNANGETLEISNLQVNIKNPQLQINPNAIGIVGFIPIIAVPNCQHNVNGDKSAEPSPFPTNIQLPNLCSQLTHLVGQQINEKKPNQPPPT